MTTFFPKPLDKQVAAISDSLSQTQDGLAIVANGNTHAAISSGQFVYVKNHDTLAEGLYKATSAIAANGTLSTSKLTPDGSGGLNDLQSQVTSLNSNIKNRLHYRNWRSYATIEAAIKGEYANLDVGGNAMNVALSGGYLYCLIVVKSNSTDGPTNGIYFQYNTNKAKTFVYTALTGNYSESNVVQPSDIPEPTSLEWTLVKKQKGKTAINLPTTAKEYLFVLSYGTATSEQSLSLTFVVPNDASMTTKTLTSGYYLANGNCCGQVSFNASQHTATITVMQINGAEYADTSYLYAYYR